jgi:hypothetical protein
MPSPAGHGFRYEIRTKSQRSRFAQAFRVNCAAVEERHTPSLSLARSVMERAYFFADAAEQFAESSPFAEKLTCVGGISLLGGAAL